MTQAFSGRRRFLALVFPFLAADLMWRRARTSAGVSPADAPHVFTVKQRGAFRLHALDERACALGLEPGMSLADARACLPELIDLPHDPEGEAALLAHLADMAERYTPMVAIDLPEALVLDIAGCAHLFGGEDALVHEAAHFMTGCGMRVSHARGDTPEAALALARFTQHQRVGEAEAITALPLLALRVAPDVVHGLRRAGFTCIGDLAKLASAPLATRFGMSLVDALDRLLGRTDSRITPRREVPPIFVERRFAEPVGHMESIMAALGALLDQASLILAERHEGGRRFILWLYRSDGAVRSLGIETGAPVRDPAVILRLVTEKIEALVDPLDPGFGFDMLRLTVPRTDPLDAEQAVLSGDRRSIEALTALLDRLGTRMGHERFCRLLPHDSHIPEHATHLKPVARTASEQVSWDAPSPGESPLRPLTLFDPPERVEAIAQVPDGPPRQFRWRGSAYRIVAQEGPERIAPEWWRRPRGHAEHPGLTRDYYRVEDESGQRFWLFRYGLYERETDRPGWYLHGLFA